jgi:hypothetical protein
MQECVSAFVLLGCAIRDLAAWMPADQDDPGPGKLARQPSVAQEAA